MKELAELLETEEPGIAKIRGWIEGADRDCLALPPSRQRESLLVQTQLSTRTLLGALIYETGGLLVDGGWIRHLGSGHERLGRSLPAWNEGRSHGFLLVADDAVSGFYALNSGGLGDDRGRMYYLAPDRLDWEPLGIGHGRFLRWTLGPKLDDLYQDLRWPTWREDVTGLPGDRTFAFYPPLWGQGGSLGTSERRKVRVWDVYRQKMELRDQLG